MRELASNEYALRVGLAEKLLTSHHEAVGHFADKVRALEGFVSPAPYLADNKMESDMKEVILNSDGEECIPPAKKSHQEGESDGVFIISDPLTIVEEVLNRSTPVVGNENRASTPSVVNDKLQDDVTPLVGNRDSTGNLLNKTMDSEELEKADILRQAIEDLQSKPLPTSLVPFRELSKNGRKMRVENLPEQYVETRLKSIGYQISPSQPKAKGNCFKWYFVFSNLCAYFCSDFCKG